jgi:hypothetical protein
MKKPLLWVTGVDGCARTARLRDRQIHIMAGSGKSRNSADRIDRISRCGSIASATSRSERRGGPISRGGPSVLPMKPFDRVQLVKVQSS